MNFIYTTPNGQWSINEQEDMFGSESFYVIYRQHQPESWYPYKLVGNSLYSCFVWFRWNKIISGDEMRYQISLIPKKLPLDK